MSDQSSVVASPTLIHFIEYAVAEYTLCNDTGTVETVTMDPAKVTCFRCRNSTTFKRVQREGVEAPTPIKLSGVMAAAPEMQTLHRAGLAYIVKRGLNSGTNDGEHEALTELADALGLTYDDDTESYR